MFLHFYNAFDLNNQKILWLPSIFQFERKLGFWTTLEEMTLLIHFDLLHFLFQFYQSSKLSNFQWVKTKYIMWFYDKSKKCNYLLLKCLLSYFVCLVQLVQSPLSPPTPLYYGYSLDQFLIPSYIIGLNCSPHLEFLNATSIRHRASQDWSEHRPYQAFYQFYSNIINKPLQKKIRIFIWASLCTQIKIWMVREISVEVQINEF